MMSVLKTTEAMQINPASAGGCFIGFLRIYQQENC